MTEPAILLFNKYGYRLNLLNPQIRSLYDRYKYSKGLPYSMGISDEQRKEFENAVLQEYSKVYESIYGEKWHYPCHDYQRQQMNEIIDRITLNRKEDENDNC